MTVGGIILCILGTLVVLVIAGLIAYSLMDNDYKIGALGVVAVGMAIIAGIWVFGNWWYTGTEEGKRALKTQDSNFNGGITREVMVYDMDGDLLAEYRGKFDIEYSDERIMFDDENGQRHIIYFKSGTVVVNELPE
jgi:uncharacterized membrane protein YeaQ/YmgE (transglycosylase-associated protein family)